MRTTYMVTFMIVVLMVGLVMSCSQLKDILASPQAQIIERELEKEIIEILEEIIEDELK